jgi:hypothetical protein
MPPYLRHVYVFDIKNNQTFTEQSCVDFLFIIIQLLSAIHLAKNAHISACQFLMNTIICK